MKFGTVVIIRIHKRCGDAKRLGLYLTSFTVCTSVRIYYNQYLLSSHICCTRTQRTRSACSKEFESCQELRLVIFVFSGF